jgi:hypothetical protein
MWMRSYVRKIVMSGLVAAAALLGCAGPAFAGTGTTGTTGVAVTAAAGGKTAEAAFLQAIAARYPQGSAAGRIAAQFLGRLSARAEASASSRDVSVGTGISCASPTACLSVGVHEVDSSTASSITPFAARLHAGAWKAVPVKTPKGAKFDIPTGVSCKAATFCLVTGVALTNTAGPVPFALAWDGTTLTPVAAPPLPAHTVGVVDAVSCVAVNSCVAVGDGTTMNTGTDVRIIWTWNGAAWARTTVPDADPGTMTELYGLHCLSVTSCIVIGYGPITTGSSSGADTLLAASWNGTAFTDLHAPQPSGVSMAVFNGLSCVSAHSCAVVGDGYNGNTGFSSPAFAEVWNGKTWTVTKWSGPKGDTIAELNDVSCASAVRCIAVGDHGTAKSGTPAALGWNGSKWTVLKVAGPGTGKAAAFEAVSCPVNGKCVTTGVEGKADDSTGTAIAGYWNGSAWKYGPMLQAAAA